MRPFVGPPQVGTGCAYSPDLAAGQCGAAPAVHIAVSCPWGVVGLLSCDDHASLARAAGQPIAEHGYGALCDEAMCWDVVE